MSTASLHPIPVAISPHSYSFKDFFKFETLSASYKMSFISTLLTEAESIGKFVHHNAKDVGHTATAVGTAAKSEGEKTLPAVVQKTDEAGADLKDKVDRDRDLKKPKETSSGPYDLAGLWPSPPSSQNPMVPPSYASDIEKSLTVNKLPTTVGKGKDAIDVG